MTSVLTGCLECATPDCKAVHVDKDADDRTSLRSSAATEGWRVDVADLDRCPSCSDGAAGLLILGWIWRRHPGMAPPPEDAPTLVMEPIDDGTFRVRPAPSGAAA